MPRKKTAADERYNARRRAKRLQNRLERDKGGTKNERKARIAYIEKLKSYIKKSYTGPKRNNITYTKKLTLAEKIKEKLNSFTKNIRLLGKPQQRRNELFKRQINLARNNEESTLKGFGQSGVNIFYYATSRIWKGYPIEQRNELIMKALGTKSLEEAFTKVLSQNRKALVEARRQSRGVKGSVIKGLTDENAEFYTESYEDEGRLYEPDAYLPYVNFV